VTDLPALAEGPPTTKSVTVPTKGGAVARVRGKLKAACDAMVWTGVEWDTAARQAGLTVRAMRAALERQPVVAYLREQKAAFRESARAANIHHAVELRRQTENRMAALGAVKYLDDDGRGAPSGGRHVTPGIVIVIGHAPRPTPDQTLIEINPVETPEAVE
jgi:hypothetical protein